MPENRPQKNSRASRCCDRRRWRHRPRVRLARGPARAARCASIERSEPGSGASGVAAGMLAPVGEATWGEEELLDAALASHAHVGRVRRRARRAGHAESSLFRTARSTWRSTPTKPASCGRRFDLMRSLGLEAEWLTGRECRELEPGLGPSAFAGVTRRMRRGLTRSRSCRALRRACEAARASRSSAAPAGHRCHLGWRRDQGRRHGRRLRASTRTRPCSPRARGRGSVDVAACRRRCRRCAL